MDHPQQDLDRLQQDLLELQHACRYQEAIGLATHICELIRQRSGQHHPDHAVSLNNLAELYHEVADYSAAERLYRQALAILEAAAESDGRRVSDILGNLARLYQATGRYKAAEPLLRRALDMARCACGDQGRELATAINNMARFHEETGRLAEAEPLLQEALEVLRRSVPKDDPDFATALNNLGTFYFSTGRIHDARPLLEQALAIRQHVFGGNHLAVAQSFNNLAALDRTLGNFVAAASGFRESLEIRRQFLDERHPDIATALDNLADVLKLTASFAEAERLFQQALEIRRAAFGPDHPEVALSLNNLAGLHVAVANYAAAAPLYEQALALRQRQLGHDHPDVASSLNNLALLYYELGNYEPAKPLLIRALEIRRQAFGRNHPDVAASLDNLAALHREMGSFDAAAPLFREALEIRRQVFGEDYPEVAVSLNNLAALYRDIGDYDASETYFVQALAINRKVFGSEHPVTATGLHNLAGLYRTMAREDEAKSLYQEALEITRRALGDDHPKVVQSLNNLAALYYSQKNFSAALPLMEQAVASRRQELGERHPFLANSLNNLALTHSAMGNHAASEPLLTEAIAIWANALGDDHPDVANGLANLTRLLAATDREQEAFAQIRRALAILNGVIGKVFSIGSERQRMRYLTIIRRTLDLFLSLGLRGQSAQPGWTGTALDTVLRRKGLGAEALAAQRDTVLGGKYPELAPKLQTLTTLRRQISRKTLDGPGPEGPEAHRRRLADWEAERERLEAELAGRIPELRLEQQLRAADPRAVREKLPNGAILVEFVRFDVADFKAVPARGEPPWQPAHYLAFVLPAERSDGVKMVPLGEAEPIDRALAAFREAIGGGGRHIGPRRKGRLEEEIGRGSELRGLVFDPLLPHLRGRTRLFLAPDGELTRLPFEVLPTADGRRLIDDCFISYLGSGRDLLRFGVASSGDPGEPMVVAGPDFDLSAAAELSAPAETSALPGRRLRDLDRSGEVHFEPLQGAREEGERIAALLGVEPLLGSDALEATVKTRRSPRIFHLATHGLFLPDQPRDPNTDSLSPAVSLATTGDRLQHLTYLESPLLRSFLALAGANTWLRGGRLPEAAEDGMLNAEDVSGLDLLGTELVVLSACETALGSVHAGEGVFGLQRAFVLAGAKTLVMSQWQVPDAQTRELMEWFYRHILAGKGRAEALRCAQLALKAKHPDAPARWGAFICLGDAGPLPDGSS